MLNRVRPRLRAVSPSLWALLASSLVLALAWATLMPPFQGPDESSHFAYTQRMVENRSIPWYPSGPPATARQGVSSELGQFEFLSGEQALIGNLGDRANWTEVDERIWAEQDARLSDDGDADGGYTTAMRYPPLYYLYTAIPYALFDAAPIYDRAYVMRLAGIPLLLGTVVFAWLCAGEIFGRRRWLQTTVAGVVALNPQLLHLTTVVNPDAMLAFLGSAMLYLSLVVARRGLSRGRVAWLVAVTAGCALTHPRGVSLAAAAAVAIAIAAWRRGEPHDERARRLARIAAIAVALASAVVLTFVAAGGPSPARARQFLSYLWQFYLPRAGFMDPSIRPDWGARQVFSDRFFGTYGQLDATFTREVFDLVWLGARIGLLLLLAALVAQHRRVRANLDVVLVLGTALVAYVLLNHVLAFRALMTNPLDPVLTGRYLLPLIVLLGLAVAVVVRALPRAGGAVAAALSLGLALLIQFAALGAVVVRFYG